MLNENCVAIVSMRINVVGGILPASDIDKPLYIILLNKIVSYLPFEIFVYKTS